jgi:hypothetical protein
MRRLASSRARPGAGRAPLPRSPATRRPLRSGPSGDEATYDLRTGRSRLLSHPGRQMSSRSAHDHTDQQGAGDLAAKRVVCDGTRAHIRRSSREVVAPAAVDPSFVGSVEPGWLDRQQSSRFTSWSKVSTPGRVVQGIRVDLSASGRDFDPTQLRQLTIDAKFGLQRAH